MKLTFIEAIKAGITPKPGKDTVIFRPANEYGFIEMYADELNKAFQEILDKIPSVQAGIDKFTCTEIIVLDLLRANAEYYGFLTRKK